MRNNEKAILRIGEPKDKLTLPSRGVLRDLILARSQEIKSGDARPSTPTLRASSSAQAGSRNSA